VASPFLTRLILECTDVDESHRPGAAEILAKLSDSSWRTEDIDWPAFDEYVARIDRRPVQFVPHPPRSPRSPNHNSPRAAPPPSFSTRRCSRQEVDSRSTEQSRNLRAPMPVQAFQLGTPQAKQRTARILRPSLKQNPSFPQGA
jgi:hypothetical protein